MKINRNSTTNEAIGETREKENEQSKVIYGTI